MCGQRAVEFIALNKLDNGHQSASRFTNHRSFVHYCSVTFFLSSFTGFYFTFCTELINLSSLDVFCIIYFMHNYIHTDVSVIHMSTHLTAILQMNWVSQLPVDFVYPLFEVCAYFLDRPEFSIYGLASSRCVCLDHCISLLPSASVVVPHLIQLASSSCSTCRSQLSLPFLVTRLTGSSSHSFLGCALQSQ